MTVNKDDALELDKLILEEKRIIAREYFLETWSSALEDGIDAEIIAHALVNGALKELAGCNGDKDSVSLITEMKSMEAEGNFLPGKTIQ